MAGQACSRLGIATAGSVAEFLGLAAQLAEIGAIGKRN